MSDPICECGHLASEHSEFVFGCLHEEDPDNSVTDCPCLLKQDAVHIVVLRQQIERYRKALEPFAEVYGAIVNEWGDDTFPNSAKFEIEYEHYKRAAAALKEPK